MGGYKCHFCAACNGRGCRGEIPGMGGPNGSRNVILNYDGWEAAAAALPAQGTDAPLPALRLAPMTGAVENVGYGDERQFYADLLSACAQAGIALSIGDGTPDSKLQYGIQAVRELPSAQRAAVFIKPYPDASICERMEWALPVAELYGVDIDSYNIATMRSLVHLEKKTAAQLRALRSRSNAAGLPFAIKGVFTGEDVELVKEVRPDVCLVSNHGGRVDTREGGVAEFLSACGETLRAHSGQLWVDGGLRTSAHLHAAAAYGADAVLLGRPLAAALCRGGAGAVARFVRGIRGA